MKINKITTGFVIQTFDTKSGKFVSQQFTAGDDVCWETLDGRPMDGQDVEKEAGYLAFDMMQPLVISDLIVQNENVEEKKFGKLRETGEHLFNGMGGMSQPVRCVTCGCDEDDAYLGGEVCSFVE